MQVQVVIPCFNEEGSLPALLEQLKIFTNESDISFVLVNNGSSDGTEEILQRVTQENIRVIHLDKNRGYGGGILAGLAVCNAPIVGWMHADLQTSPDVLLKVNAHRATPSFIKGRRKGRKILDIFFTIGMAFVESMLFRKVMWDINAQPTLFPRTWFEGLQDPPTDFSLDLFVYVNAKQTSLSIVRFPVKFEQRISGSSTWNTGLKSRMKFVKRTMSYSLSLRRSGRVHLSTSQKSAG